MHFAWQKRCLHNSIMLDFQLLSWLIDWHGPQDNHEAILWVRSGSKLFDGR